MRYAVACHRLQCTEMTTLEGITQKACGRTCCQALRQSKPGRYIVRFGTTALLLLLLACPTQIVRHVMLLDYDGLDPC
jgi:hypothetical protein